MLTYYCPKCWEIVEVGQRVCPSCGYILDDFSHFDFDDKLIAALHHSVAERKIMAAQVLGMRQCKRALPEFITILESSESNYFFLRAILLAVAKIDDPDREKILERATKHNSELISHLASELLGELRSGKIRGQWDRHTG
jgi:hypothetical protein